MRASAKITRAVKIGDAVLAPCPFPLLSSSPAAKNTIVPHLRERREGGEEKEEAVICGLTLAEYKQLQLKTLA